MLASGPDGAGDCAVTAPSLSHVPCLAREDAVANTDTPMAPGVAFLMRVLYLWRYPNVRDQPDRVLLPRSFSLPRRPDRRCRSEP